MSGTSLDGLDICYSKFIKTKNYWDFEILTSETIPYSSEWENALKNAIHLSGEALLKLNADYGFYLGEKTQEFIDKHKIRELDLIGSHGHTVFHQPKNKFTFQIGDGRAIKSKTNATVIYDFRSQDVIFGGNGAPLVPIGDELLFPDYEACLNLGGFSNISLNRNGKRIAFDIGPVNILLNSCAEKLGKKFDNNGEIARTGNIDHQLLADLNKLDFYKQNAPKSLGIEWINDQIFPIIRNQKAEDLLATFTEHAAIQIANIFDLYDIKNVLITGGGAYNSYLIEKIKSRTKTEINIPIKEIIEYKEALIFAFMGILRSLNINNVLCSATGSKKDHCSGLIVNK